MKVAIETSQYSVCDRCGDGARDGDPLLKIGQFSEWVIAHKSCLDEIVKEAESVFAQWRAYMIAQGKLKECSSAESTSKPLDDSQASTPS